MTTKPKTTEDPPEPDPHDIWGVIELWARDECQRPHAPELASAFHRLLQRIKEAGSEADALDA